jgi:hypothetical protein
MSKPSLRQLKAWAGEQGYAIKTYPDGQTAIEVLRGLKPCVIARGRTPYAALSKAYSYMQEASK